MKKNLTVKKRLVQTAVLLDTVKNRLTDAATSTVPEILSHLGSRLTGLSENEVREQRSHFGKTPSLKGKRNPLGGALPKRLLILLLQF